MKPPAENIARHLVNTRHKQAGKPHEVRAHHTDTDRAGELLITSLDAYQAMKLATTKHKPRYLSLTTEGWAAKTDPDNPGDTPPSLDPNRQRVALAVVIDTDTNQITSAMRLSTARRPLIATDKEAHGALSDALQELARRIATN
jgi:hypothetical protein